jgi:PEGA domain
VALMLAFPTTPAEAQPHHHSVGFSQWYPYPYPPFGVPPGNGAVSLRVQVTPREAQVFVDGFAAGVVDDYDGVFQRLRLIPGPHEIVVYHTGHRTFRQNIYYNPGSTHTIRYTLDRLMPGERQEPQPVPRALLPPPGIPGQPGAPPNAESGRVPEGTRVGTLALRVQPGDATVAVDGEPWRGPQTQDRFVIQLAEGPHRVRIEKPGFQTFAVDVDVRAGETTSFNVSLLAR